MRNLVSSGASLDADRTAETRFGYPPLLLMEEASIRLGTELNRLQAAGAWGPGTAVFLAGPGNNGGDALAMARHRFLRGGAAAVVQVFPPKTPSSSWNHDLAGALGIERCAWPSDRARVLLGTAAVWVDGVFGAGVRGPLRAGAAEVLGNLEALRVRTRIPVAAVDVPSGLHGGWVPGDPVLRAGWTLVPGDPKDFCYHPGARETGGILISVPLSYPVPAVPSARLAEESDLPDLLPPVGSGDHKSSRGHVAVAGGSPGMAGALVLAARSAAAAGAGLVSLGTDRELISLVAPQVPAFQVVETGQLAGRASRYRALVAGPGWGRTPDRPGFLKELWATGIPLVVDADGLGAWADLDIPHRSEPVVLTPHPGEFLSLAGETCDPVGAAGNYARDRGVTVVLKGAVTWVLGPDGRRGVWDGSNPALGTGGSGDCLAGVVGAFLARGMGGFEAGLAAVVLHGTAGRHLAAGEGWFTADRLPEALARTAFACRKEPGRL